MAQAIQTKQISMKPLMYANSIKLQNIHQFHPNFRVDVVWNSIHIENRYARVIRMQYKLEPKGNRQNTLY